MPGHKWMLVFLALFVAAALASEYVDETVDEADQGDEFGPEATTQELGEATEGCANCGNLKCHWPNVPSCQQRGDKAVCDCAPGAP
eukprot:CAMPEP_0114545210 /NCGR_PEP_ID=MMETSP0114-20121206/3278_1 /TAXON_ID=31324 /ORGANISM="Goniomonas sp, Strain m" /LENGTH=85 /DNA_ID=CAMNT_0001729621 /DNA_START=14 /DNA_END=271 /DNA_ORIENTATION=-